MPSLVHEGQDQQDLVYLEAAFQGLRKCFFSSFTWDSISDLCSLKNPCILPSPHPQSIPMGSTYTVIGWNNEGSWVLPMLDLIWFPSKFMLKLQCRETLILNYAVILYTYGCGLRLSATKCILAQGSRLPSNAFNVLCYWSGKTKAGISYYVLSITSSNCTSCMPICSCLNGP